MKIKVGDTVKYLNDVGGGKVTKVLDKATALILGNDGFEVPMLIEELLVDESENEYKTSSVEPKEIIQEEVEEETFYTDSSDVNVYLAFVPKNQSLLTDSDSEVYLINDSNYYILYNYSEGTSGKYQSLTGTLSPNTKELIDVLQNDSVEDNLDVVVQLIFYDKTVHDLREPFSKHFKIRAVQFYKQNSFKENDFFDEFALLKPIIEDNPMQKAVENLKEEEIKKVVRQKEGEKTVEPTKRPRKRKRLVKEVDLHIHELIDDETGLSDKEKLDIQKDKFHSEMEEAINSNLHKIIFIHGVGNGTLKLEIRRELQRAYKKYQFQDASFREYGYGATMVILRF